MIALPEKKSLLWGLLFLILSSGTGLVYPQLVRWMVDHVLQPKKAELLLPVVLGLFGAFVVQGVASSLRYYLFTYSGEKIVIRLRQKLFQQILSQEVSFFDFQRTGELMSRLSSDCTTLQNTVSVNISQGLRNLGQVIGGFAFMFYTSWRLSALMLILVLPMAGAAALFGKKIRQFSKEFQSSLAESSVIADETISGVRTVKSFVQEKFEVARYIKAMDKALSTAQKRIQAIAQFMTLAMIVGFGSICFVLWYGGREVILQNLSIGDLTQFLLYLMIVAIGVGSLGSLWGDFMAGVGASNRVFEILEKTPEELHQGKILSPFQGKIDFQKVYFAYPSRPNVEVLKGIDFKIPAGKVIALVGSSGSGKSTIAQLLPRYYDLLKGQILIDDVPIQEVNLSWLREQIGIVSQEPILISATIEENIRYGKPDADHDLVVSAAKAAFCYDFVQKFPEGFQTQVGEKGIQLSGGQKQRVAIARALLKNPKILILDEATSNLDTESERLVQEALHQLMKGRTTLVIAHRLSTIQNADMIQVLSDGVIVQSGKHEELKQDQSGLYYQLLQKQFQETASNEN